MTEIVVRPVEGPAEREACVRLQQATWGRDFADRVPASILMLAQEMGGIVSGAFLGDRLVGFVFGITGLRDGELAHWSDMLAVDPEVRGRGVGRRLKLHQRELLLARDVPRMIWTTDPLEARNAHLNLRRLGATARTYLRELYGDSVSPLHAGIGTDRILCEWALDSERVAARVAGSGPETPARPGTILNPTAEAGRPWPQPPEGGVTPRAEVVGVVVPAEIQGLKSADPELARAWRLSVRTALEAAFREGYVAVDFISGPVVGTYVLARGLSL